MTNYTDGGNYEEWYRRHEKMSYFFLELTNV